MGMHRFAAGGVGLVALMYAFFLLTSLDTPSGFLALPVVGLVASVACAAGLWLLPERRGLLVLAGGVGGLAAVRVFFYSLGLADGFSGEDLVGTLMLGGLLLALGHAAAWAWRPQDAAARARGVRVGFALVAVAYFFTMVGAVGQGDLATAIGLALGCAGFAWAAPNVEVVPAAGARGERASGYAPPS